MQAGGLRTDAAALARFVRSGTQMMGPEPRQAVADGVFVAPAYTAPVELSPTQRFEVRRRARRGSQLRWLALPVSLALAAALGYAAALVQLRGPLPAGAANPAATADDR